MTAAWEQYVGDRFPGFLLPKSVHHSVSVANAEAFLQHLGLRARDLTTLRVMSLLAAHGDVMENLVTYWLPELVRVLPSRTRVQQRTWRGGYQGRLDVRATLPHHIAGRRDVYVTQARYRDFALPENVFVRSLAGRTLRALEGIRDLGLLHGEHWTAGVVRSLASLRVMLNSTALREIDELPVTTRQLQAARHARHSAYRFAIQWYQLLTHALDRHDPKSIARVLSEGALAPMDAPKRFEVAVLLRLLDALASKLAPEDGWEVTRNVIVRGRKEIAIFERGGRKISVYYDQAVLPSGDTLGPRDRGVAHYFGAGGRLRPDITLSVEDADGRKRHVVFEIKHTENPSYAKDGYGEAIVYRHEYAQHLTGWPKAVVVTSCPVEGKPRREDDVVAVSWDCVGGPGLVEALVGD